MDLNQFKQIVLKDSRTTTLVEFEFFSRDNDSYLYGYNPVEGLQYTYDESKPAEKRWRYSDGIFHGYGKTLKAAQHDFQDRYEAYAD